MGSEMCIRDRGTMDFDVAEIIGYDHALTSPEEASLNAYFTTKYWTSPDPFTAWLDTNYPGLSDKTPGGDPDGDGMTNFAEYAFGLNPSSGASVNPISPLVGKTFSYTRTSGTGLNYKVWHSVNLQDWHSDLATQGTATSMGGGVESVPVTLDDSLLTEPKLFLRVTAE